jgi:tetratricopeptide (TPR) repeat protein
MTDLDSQAARLDSENRAEHPEFAGGHHAKAKRLSEFHGRAIEHVRSGQLSKAQSRARQAFKLDPENAETMHIMAVIGAAGKQFDHAIEWAFRAIRKNPHPAYLATLGQSLLSAGRLDEALKVIDKAVQLKPDDADLWRNLGLILSELGRFGDAVLAFQHVLKLDPRDWDAANRAARILYRTERLDEALVHFNICDALRPNHFPTVYGRALTLQRLGRLEEALAETKRAQRLEPANADACGHIGNLLRSLGRSEEALPWFDQSLALRPASATASRDKAIALVELHRFDEAFAGYRRALAIDPGDAITHWNLALLQMLTGDFEAGWAGCEARLKIPSLSAGYPKFPQPMWLGTEPLAGKTIVVCADEGLGDSIQFVRYVPMLAKLGARVILVVQDALCPLFSGLEGVWQCLPGSGARVPPFDFHLPLCSLPFVFGTRLETIPAATPYLPAPVAERVRAWEERLGRRDRLRVGLVWSGNPKHENDRNRSVPLRTLTRILDTNADFISLQKDVRPDDRATLLERTEIFDAASHLTDFGDTAALISCLDLVISVDTSVAHLSGALGKPTWILLPYTPDYRWLLDREDSPWYPTVRLFRQSEGREYDSVVDRVREALTNWLDEPV